MPHPAPRRLTSTLAPLAIALTLLAALAWVGTAWADHDPGHPDAGNSTVVAADPTFQVSDDTTTTITVTVLDGGGDPVPNQTVTLVGDPDGNVFIGAASGDTDANGVVTFPVRNTVAETVEFTATVTTPDPNVTITQTATVTFFHGGINHFEVDLAGGGAIGTQTASEAFNIRIRAFDEFDNLMDGASDAAAFTGTVDLTTNSAFADGVETTTAAFEAGVLASHSVTLTLTGTGRTLTATRTGGAETGTSNEFTVNPGFTAVSPDNRGQGAQNQALTVTGAGFADGADVTFSDVGITVNDVTFVDATELTVNITVDAAAATGPRNLTVQNPDTTSVTENNAFTVNAGPAFTSITPDELIQGASGQDLALAGSDLVDGASVAFSGTGITVNDVTFVDATELTVNVTVSGGAATGARDVTITNPDAGTITASSAFTVTAAPPPPPPPDPVIEPEPEPETVDVGGNVEVAIENEQTATVAEDEPVTLSISTDSGSATVDAPAGALPAGSTLSLAALADPDAVAQQAPPPEGADLALGFVIRALDANGDPITGDFAEPVQLTFTLAPGAVPDDAPEGTIVLAFWNGNAWVEINAEVTRNDDGGLTITASVSHFTLFGLFHQPGRGTLTPEPAATGVSLAVWGGGPIDLLPPATSYWITHEGNLVGYTVGAPAFVNAAFQALHPDGRIPPGTLLLAVH